jgi:hypothetical protein
MFLSKWGIVLGPQYDPENSESCDLWSNPKLTKHVMD